MTENNTVYLIDGSALCYRSFYALKLSTSKGVPSGAVYGVYQALKRLIARFNPEYIAVCFDVSRTTFRTQKYEQYKMQRPPMPDDLVGQIPRIKQMVAWMGIALLECPGYEADDIMAAVTQKARADQKSVVLVTADKDMYQLLDDCGVSILHMMTDKKIARDEFVQMYGFQPGQIVDYLALVGDSSDNIPGAKGIGKVGATALIQQFGTIEQVFLHIDQVSAKMRDKLIASKEMIFLSKDLVTLAVPELPLRWSDLKRTDVHYEPLHNLFREFELRQFLKDVDTASHAPVTRLSQTLEHKKHFEHAHEMVVVVEGDQAFVWDSPQNAVQVMPVQQLCGELQGTQVSLVTYAAKTCLAHIPELFSRACFDIKIAAYVLDASLGNYSFETIAARFADIVEADMSGPVRAQYAAQLYPILRSQLRESGCEHLFFDVEMPLIAVLCAMQSWGVAIDTAVMSQLLSTVDEQIRTVNQTIFGLAGKEFNLNSPKQLQQVLFEELSIPPVKRMKTGYSTDEEVLEKLAEKFPIAQALLECRQLYKLRNTYVCPLREHVADHHGKLHTTFRQTGTQTGRLSSSSPNLQSIPTKGDLSQLLRRAFVPSYADGVIMSADYSQIELRILAHFSRDETLMSAFQRHADIHTYTASVLFDIPQETVTHEQRQTAKRINFGIMYGMSAYGLARELAVSTQQAQQFIDDYFQRYPKVQLFYQQVYAQVKQHGYVTTLLGRRRYLPDFLSSNARIREFAQRQAINTPIQGSCADLVKTAMVRIYNQLQSRGLRSKMIIQIHDDLVFDVPGDEVQHIVSLVRSEMEQSLLLAVPIEVHIKYGPNWGQMTECSSIHV